MRLAFRWARIAETLSLRGNVEQTANGILERYIEPHRAYHNVNHLAHVLRELDEYSMMPRESALAELALWFHDAVYDPQSRENEHRSAILADRVLSFHQLPVKDIDRVTALIEDTRSHIPTADPLSAIVNDCDLAILGAEPDAYARYAQAVRQEFLHLDDAAWHAGRKDFLRSMRARHRLYFSRRGYQLHENKARENIARELDSLP